MINHSTFHNDERGMVSFFAVIFISVLLVIVSTGFIRIMVAEQRQAIDDDLANRALYAAETGVEDAIVEIRQRTMNNQSLIDIMEKCNSANLNNSFDISYTCQIIERAAFIEGEIPVEKTAEIDLTNLTGVDKFKLEWHKKGLDAVNPVPNVGTTALNNNTSPIVWQNSHIPALMRMNIISYPTNNIQSSGSPSPNIVNDNIFIYPTSSSLSPLNIALASSGRGRCTPGAVSDEYACVAEINGFSSNANKIIKLVALQTSTHYRLTALDSSGNVVRLPSSVLNIDSTGRAGDVLRRARVTVRIERSDSSGSINAALGRNVVITDKSICKDFGFYNSAGTASPNTGCESEPVGP